MTLWGEWLSPSHDRDIDVKFLKISKCVNCECVSRGARLSPSHSIECSQRRKEYADYKNSEITSLRSQAAGQTNFGGRSGGEYRDVGRSIVTPKGRSGPLGSIVLVIEASTGFKNTPQ